MSSNGKSGIGGDGTTTDCTHALTPQAYLADLLDYVLTYMEKDNEKLSLETLSDIFERNFDDLPVTSHAVSGELSYVRICVEVLIRYLNGEQRDEEGNRVRGPVEFGTAGPDGGPLDTQHRLDVYETLLSQWGTSHQEIKQARYSSDVRKSVADRLEIAPKRVAGGDSRDLDLFPDSAPDAADTLSQSNLAEIFGFEPTLIFEDGRYKPAPRDSLDASDAKLYDWRVTHMLNRWQSMDHPSDPYLRFDPSNAVNSRSTPDADTIPVVHPDLIGPDDFRNPTDDDAAFGLWLKRRQWLDVQLDQLETLVNDGWNEPEPLDRVLASLADAFVYGEGADPIPSNPDSADKRSNPLEGWSDLSWTPATLDTGRLRMLASAATGKLQGSRLDEDRTRTELESIGLSVETVTRIETLLEKRDSARRSNKNEPVTDAERREIASILSNIRTMSLSDNWALEEVEVGVALEPQSFWMSRREPAEGIWSNSLDRHAADAPFIDPERVSRENLPDIPFGRDPIRLYEKRRDELKEKMAEFIDTIHRQQASLQAAYEQHVSIYWDELASLSSGSGSGDRSPLDPVLTDIWGPPNGSWQEEFDEIASGLQATDDPNDQTDAYSQATSTLDSLHLSPDDFWRLRALRRQSKPGDGETLTEDDLSEALRLLPTGNPFDQVLTDIYGASTDSWKDHLEAIRTAVRESGTDVKELTALDLTYAEFEKLINAYCALSPASERTPPDNDELHAVIEPIVTAWKLRAKYTSDEGGWIHEEKTGEWITDLDPSASPSNHTITSYWRAYKARLPKWRVSKDERSDWQQALQIRGSRPIVDPDLLDESMMVSESAAEVIRNRREDLLEGPSGPGNDIRTAIANVENGSQDLGTVLTNVIGIGIDELRRIHERASAGENVIRRLSQLDLTPASFFFLFGIIEKYEGPTSVTDVETTAITNLLLGVWKHRQFARWRLAERQEDIDLIPKQFDLQAVKEAVSPANLDEGPMRWRLNADAYLAWINILERRTNTLKDIREQVDSAVKDTAEVTLPDWRDTSIEQVEASGQQAGFEETAEWISERLLVDVETDGCRDTTRVNQAIEAMQTLVFILNTGQTQGGIEGLGLALEDPYFEERWRWIGTYAKWRSAMGVFLYPENVLIPTLRTNSSPTFDSVAGDVRGSRPLVTRNGKTPPARYAEYFRDISNLEPKAACTTVATLAGKSRVSTGGIRGSGGGPTVVGNQNWRPPSGLGAARGETNYVGYVIAKTESADRYYYRAFDLSEDRPDQISDLTNDDGYWTRIDAFDEMDGTVETVHGAQGYRKSMFIFLTRIQDSNRTLGYIQYNGTWSDFRPIPLANSASQPASVHLLRDTSVAQAMELFVQDKDGNIFIHPFNWAAEPPKSGDVIGPVFETGLQSYTEGVEGANLEEIETWVEGLKSVVGDLVAVVRHGQLRYLVINAAVSPFSARPRRFVHDTVTTPSYYVCWDTRTRRFKATPEGWDFYGGVMNILSKTKSIGDIWTTTMDADWDGRHRDLGEVSLNYTVELSSAREAFRDGNTMYVLGDTRATTDAVRGEDPGVFDSEDTMDSLDIPGEAAGSHVWVIDLDGSGPGEHTLSFRPAQYSTKWREIISAYDQFVGSVPVPPTFRAGDPTSLVYCNGAVELPSFEPGMIDTTFIKRADPLGDVGSQGYVYSDPNAGIGIQCSRFVTESENRMYSLYDTISLAPVAEPYGDGPWPNGVDDVESSDLDRATEAHARRTEHVFDGNNTPLRRSNLVYINEAFFHVPLLVARELNRSGRFEQALDWFRTIYDYSQDAGDQSIWHGLTAGAGHAPEITPSTEWLRSPITPHAIVTGRPNTGEKYTQFTIFSIVRCLLDYGDEEFSRDTGASIARARNLYETALDLLEVDALDTLELEDYLSIELTSIADDSPTPDGGQALIGESWKDYGELLDEETRRRILHEKLLVNDWVAEAVAAAANTTEAASVSDNTYSSGGSGTSLSGRTSVDYGRGTSRESVDWLTVKLGFCIPANPYPEMLARKAEAELSKIHSCRNIAGMRREVDPFSVSTDFESAVPTPESIGALDDSGTVVQPTDYRYETLIGRAKKLVNLARQLESEFLGAIEKAETEEYRMMQARQDIGLARTKVQLQDLRVEKAGENVMLTQLELERARIQAEHYSRLISHGLLNEERMALEYMQASKGHLQAALDAYQTMMIIQGTMGGIQVAAGLLAGALGNPLGFVAAFETAGQTAGRMAQTQASVDSTQASIASQWAQIMKTQATYKRRRQRWQLQNQIARQDVRIGNQKLDVARTDVDIARMQRQISNLQVEYANDRVHYLANEQFTNEDLYRWMSRILGDIYRYFLQQAASIARLAESQLAFEHQTHPPSYISSNYWNAPADGRTLLQEDNALTVDRRGLTGSARLLQDIYALDQHEFRTEQRKLEVQKTFSMADMDPVVLQVFRETGVLPFVTSLEEYDRDYPGQYLRLVKDVSVQVVALTPPVDGIKATLWSSGTSRVVVGDTVFRERTIRRSPEEIVLKPTGQGGQDTLELQPEGNDLLRPFENMGVAASWELRMPRPANEFDFDTVADVLLTVKYTALNSHEYRQQVVERLDPVRAVARSFTFSENLIDQWYDLNNPAQTDEPMRVTFKTDYNDFPSNISNLEIEDLQLYFVGPDPEAIEDYEATLTFSAAGEGGAAGGSAIPVDGVIDTPSASSWQSILGKPPAGEWMLDLTPYRSLFESDVVADLMLVVTVSGRLPDWPK